MPLCKKPFPFFLCMFISPKKKNHLGLVWLKKMVTHHSSLNFYYPLLIIHHSSLNPYINEKVKNSCLVRKLQSRNSGLKSTFCQNGGAHETDIAQKISGKLPRPFSLHLFLLFHTSPKNASFPVKPKAKSPPTSLPKKKSPSTIPLFPLLLFNLLSFFLPQYPFNLGSWIRLSLSEEVEAATAEEDFVSVYSVFGASSLPRSSSPPCSFFSSSPLSLLS